MLPHEIETESFRIIRSELREHAFSDDELSVVVRMIHATGDFDFVEITRFHPQAIRSGIEALRSGCTVVTDVRMVQAGIASRLLEKLYGNSVCDIQHPEVRIVAEQEGLTRSTLAMRRNKGSIEGGIAAVGNAPTALLEVIRMVREEELRPGLIIGVPVGFVNAAESKEELLTLDVPYITTVGRKGGSTVAVAVINALLNLAHDA